VEGAAIRSGHSLGSGRILAGFQMFL
jgi:hypothetical protein